MTNNSVMLLGCVSSYIAFDHIEQCADAVLFNTQREYFYQCTPGQWRSYVANVGSVIHAMACTWATLFAFGADIAGEPEWKANMQWFLPLSLGYFVNDLSGMEFRGGAMGLHHVLVIIFETYALLADPQTTPELDLIFGFLLFELSSVPLGLGQLKRGLPSNPKSDITSKEELDAKWYAYQFAALYFAIRIIYFHFFMIPYICAVHPHFLTTAGGGLVGWVVYGLSALQSYWFYGIVRLVAKLGA